MPMVMAARVGVLLGAAMGLAACTTLDLADGPSDETDADLVRPPSTVTEPDAEPEGEGAAYCPQITLREGTAILRKEVSGGVDYIASITDTNRDCRIVDGRFVMEVGIRGTVTPGPVAESRDVPIPVRVAILRDGKVVYSELGERTVAVSTNAGVQSFTYVDQGIDVGGADIDGLTVFAGFDEGSGD